MPSGFELYPFRAGQRVVMRKKHPCGGYAWDIVRAGADITARCTTCGHTVKLQRRAFERAVRSVQNEESGNE